MRRALTAAVLLVLVSLVLGATVFREQIASAAKGASLVLVTNDESLPVPVHEQGTANVNVTNTSLAVAPPTPITGGGVNAFDAACGDTYTPNVTVTALVIHMTPGVAALEFYLGDRTHVAASFVGPFNNGPADIQLALNRPIQFDHVTCFGTPADRFSLSWVGSQP